VIEPGGPALAAEVDESGVVLRLPGSEGAGKKPLPRAPAIARRPP
jgi:hypothetical protein